MDSSYPIVWRPTEEMARSSALSEFMREAERVSGKTFSSYEELHTWSVADSALFWRTFIRRLGLICEGSDERVCIQPESQETPLMRSWFPDLRLNFSENLLKGSDEDIAIVSWSEESVKRHLTRRQIREKTLALVHHLTSSGINPDDRAFAYLPNIPEAIMCMLGTTAIGASWSSCGCDYGIAGLFDRAEQLQPKVLYAAASYLWKGEQKDLRSVVAELVSRIPSIEHLVWIQYPGSDTQTLDPEDVHIPRQLKSVVTFDTLSSPAAPVVLPRFSFAHPLYVMFSSGTTGKPKAIVHSAGGTLLEHVKEHILHSDIKRGDTVFYQTSVSWMMWNWLVSVLASDAAIAIYDGDPFLHDGFILWEMAEAENITHFGTSAAYLGTLEKRRIIPAKHVNLPKLRAVLSTGSTLYPSQFDFIKHSIKDLWIQSISGGTDIIGCFGLGCPLLPVRRGALQCKSLGYDVQALNENGERVYGEEGELVCASPAPSMPIYFLNDADGSLYRKAYFDSNGNDCFADVWRHGDRLIELREGGLLFLGRSDATLKPAGVRVSTADIYAALHGVSAVIQALAVGFTPPNDTSEKVILFVVLRRGEVLSAELVEEIKQTLRGVNRYYTPHLVLDAPDIPRTTNNKVAEVVVKRILRGEEITNAGALGNPECLEYFRGAAKKLVEEAFS